MFVLAENMIAACHAVLLLVAFCCFQTGKLAVARVPQEEVEALEEIVMKLGATSWKFNAESCQVESIGLPWQSATLREQDRNITCDCQSSTCHIATIELKRLSLPGVLPPDLVRLPHLKKIDLAYNYLHGSIPFEWASTQLNSITLLVNRLSGEIPRELGNITSLTYLNLEGNELNGTVPSGLRKLVNLGALILSSNRLTGNLPLELAELVNLTDFRINDNNFNGTIPDFIQNWRQLRRLEMLGSGLEGPIPSSISLLNQLTQLKVSDLKGRGQTFPDLSNMTLITRIVLRNCNISGEIPPYIWNFAALRILFWVSGDISLIDLQGVLKAVFLDLSYNKLTGKIPDTIRAEVWVFIFLTGNLLSGNVPESILKDGANVILIDLSNRKLIVTNLLGTNACLDFYVAWDLSYNNFSWQSPQQPACQQNINLNLNLFRSSSMGNDLRGLIPCRQDVRCPRYSHSFYVNCGGESQKINGHVYLREKLEGGAAEFQTSNENWGISSTGDFMDDNNFQNKDYTAVSDSPNVTGLYSTARVAPLSLTYYHYCLENGSYTISLHFAEIQFTRDATYRSLGRRMFDIYIQEKLVQKDFNIVDEARGALTPIIKRYNVTINNNILDIRFYWAGKGTTRVPDRSAYGPLISAISVDPNFEPRSEGGKKWIAPVVAGVIGSCLILLVLGIILWRHCTRTKHGSEEYFKQLYPQMGSFSLRQIQAATNNFDKANKIGEGGFGPVYKGRLPDGTVIAVKQLSSKSKQGNREFLNEIAMISCMQHPNLVKLYGCCIEGDQLLLVYEYLKNNSLARAMHGPHGVLKLDWPTRHKICVGIARGLAFLHEESRLKIVHRDIKSTNILLDGDLNPKISDFGLAKLDEDKTHISTRVAGTMGYMAPEYALCGYLTHKADVYSFGIVALEIVSGQHQATYGPGNNYACLLDWACQLQQSGNLTELVDENLGSDFNREEAERMIRVGLLCTSATPSLRPTMSEVISMLEGKTSIPETAPEASTCSDDLRFKAIRDYQQGMRKNQGNISPREAPVMRQGFSTISGQDLYEIQEESYLRSTTMGDHNELTEGCSSKTGQAPCSNTAISSTGSSSSTARDLHRIHDD